MAGAAALVERGRGGLAPCPDRNVAPVVALRERVFHLPLLVAARGADTLSEAVEQHWRPPEHAGRRWAARAPSAAFTGLAGQGWLSPVV